MTKTNKPTLENCVKKGLGGLLFVTSLGVASVAGANIHSYIISYSFLGNNIANASDIVETYDSSNNNFEKMFSYGGYLAAKNYLGN